MIYENKAGETIVDIYLKSGEELSVYAYTDEGFQIKKHFFSVGRDVVNFNWRVK